MCSALLWSQWTGFHPIFILSAAIVGDRRVSLCVCVSVCDSQCVREAHLSCCALPSSSQFEKEEKKNENSSQPTKIYPFFFVCSFVLSARTQLIICCVSWFTTDIPIFFPPFPFNWRRSNLKLVGVWLLLFAWQCLFFFPTKKKVVLLRVCSLLLASCNYQRALKLCWWPDRVLMLLCFPGQYT